jgi:hypothetical protein
MSRAAMVCNAPIAQWAQKRVVSPDRTSGHTDGSVPSGFWAAIAAPEVCLSSGSLSLWVKYSLQVDRTRAKIAVRQVT